MLNKHTLQELRAFQEYYEKNFQDISFRCRLSPFGKELFLKHHYPNMLLEEHEGVSYLTGGYNQEELDYMVHYLISYGKHLVIEYPKQLQESYVQSLEAMISKNH
ncbi:WYL domain-containing protein [Candidatus Enterococcus ferrettii]|uniref:WYL domain-containing protein n=1 Tax=Candidatus Enterococcus ferrettii TaxID=2815324 RepID=A0ABV0ENM9_9ENTE